MVALGGYLTGPRRGLLGYAKTRIPTPLNPSRAQARKATRERRDPLVRSPTPSSSRCKEAAAPKPVEAATVLPGRLEETAAPQSAKAAVDDAKENAGEDDQVSSTPRSKRAHRPPDRR